MYDDLFLRYKAISLYRAVAAELSPLAELLIADSSARRAELCADVFRRVAESGCETTGEWINKLVMGDDNFFSRSAARGERISERVKSQVMTELTTFKQLSLLRPEDFADDAVRDFLPRFSCGGFSFTFDKLVKFYFASGCGALAYGNIFTYKSGIFSPAHSDAVRLSDLVNYAEEKAEIVRNTENFLNGLPAFHTLLYGDRGTGKSTTVRALAYEYRDRLKVIELAKNELCRLPKLQNELYGLKQKYILFIDDLGFDEADGGAEDFKVALEGSLDAPSGNVLIYCTSNRRHLFKETDKTEMRNRGDEIQAELALFDRFGLVVTYISPSKDEFIDILKQIVRSRGIKWRDEYAVLAELAALKKGGRTPRAAKQIADVIETTYAERRE
ncbi:MAG: ATP-binding protein [Roseburia sp.]|nr:ATP-binding protein [Roseburia sp.]